MIPRYQPAYCEELPPPFTEIDSDNLANAIRKAEWDKWFADRTTSITGDFGKLVIITQNNS
jgi:hypothetical protein